MGGDRAAIAFPMDSLDAMPVGGRKRFLAALRKHPLPFDCVNGMERDGRISGRLAEELREWLDGPRNDKAHGSRND